MTTQKPISKSPISDAFLSKNAEGNYLSNGCFCARCKNITGFSFTGKEKDPETGFSYFGARYLEHDLMAGWLSVDPMADKYPSISPYAYCAWNPVKLVDPDGRDGIKIVDKETKTITVRANYYVTTEKYSPDNREIVFDVGEVDRMNETINECLNSENYQVKFNGESYQVIFNLRFFEGGNEYESKVAAENDYYESIPIGNTMNIMDYNMLSHFSKQYLNPQDVPTSSLGGMTENNKNIYMSPSSNYLRNRIHEIFHTLFFDRDDAPSGIGSYQSLDLPNIDDIYLLITNEKLQTITM